MRPVSIPIINCVPEPSLPVHMPAALRLVGAIVLGQQDVGSPPEVESSGADEEMLQLYLRLI